MTGSLASFSLAVCIYSLPPPSSFPPPSPSSFAAGLTGEGLRGRLMIYWYILCDTKVRYQVTKEIIVCSFLHRVLEGTYGKLQMVTFAN